MDIEDAPRVLIQKRLRCMLSEVDRDVESLRAKKYRKILDDLAGEDGSAQPQAADIFHLPRRVSTNHDVPPPTSSRSLMESQPGSTRDIARCPSVHPPVARRGHPARVRTVAAVPQAHSDSDEDVIVVVDETHSESSTSTAVSQPGSKRHNLSSPAQSISTRNRSSFDIPPESSRISGSRNPSAFIPRGFSIVDIAGIWKRADLVPLELTRAEATRVEETPGIGWSTFSNLFGGCRRSEWPQCSRRSGYRDFLCADVIAQPFVPHAAGQPGLSFRLPTVIEAPETENHTIHVLSNTVQDEDLYYRGKYTRVPIPQIQIRWSDLPHNFRDRWIKRVATSSKLTARAIRSRIHFRNRYRREPTATEIQKYFQCFNDQVTHKEIAAAFRSGQEKLALEGLRCTGYDSYLATIIQSEDRAEQEYDN